MGESGLRALRVRRLDEARRYTAAAFAEELGVSRPTLARYERDPEVMPFRTAAKAARLLGCDVDELFNLGKKRN